MEYRKGNHSVYGLNYHIVLVTKYRKKCINEELGERLKAECIRLIEGREGRVLEIETDQDHLHILAELSPKYALAESIGILKSVTARIMRRDYAGYLSQFYWGDSFWSDSYFVASSGGVTMETLRQYVEDQGKPKKGRGRPPKKRT